MLSSEQFTRTPQCVFSCPRQHLPARGKTAATVQTNRSLALRIVLSATLAAAFALVGSGCGLNLQRIVEASILASAAQGGAWGYSPVAFPGSQYYAGGRYNGVNVQQGWYNGSAPIFQPQAVMGQYGQVIVQPGVGVQQPGWGGGVGVMNPGMATGGGTGFVAYNGGQQTITSGPTLFLQGGRIVSRSSCDQAGCEMVLPGSPGPQIVPPQGTYPGVGSVNAVQYGPQGWTSGFIPRQN